MISSPCSAPPVRTRCSPSNCSDHDLRRWTSDAHDAFAARIHTVVAGPPPRLRPPPRTTRGSERQGCRREEGEEGEGAQGGEGGARLLPLRGAARNDADDEHQADPEGQGGECALSLGV